MRSSFALTALLVSCALAATGCKKDETKDTAPAASASAPAPASASAAATAAATTPKAVGVTKPADAPEVDEALNEPADPDDLPTPKSHAAKAEAEITAANFKAELDKVEKEIGK